MLDLRILDKIKILKDRGLSYLNPDGTKKDFKSFMNELVKIWSGLSDEEKDEFKRQYEEEVAKDKKVKENDKINNMNMEDKIEK